MSNPLKNIPFFSDVPAKQLDELSQKMRSLVYRAGDILITEGTSGNTMFIIKKGRVKVSKAGRPVAELGENNFFGEISLITDEPRTATVTALEDTECFLLARSDFDELTAHAEFRSGQTPVEWRRRMVELASNF